MSNFSIKLKVKKVSITAGKLIVVLNPKDAAELSVVPNDRIELTTSSGKSVVCIIDVSDSFIQQGAIGLFEEVSNVLKVKEGSVVSVKFVSTLESLEFIKKKMDGLVLSEQEINQIVKDLNEGKLSEIEASAFISSVYINGFNLEETVAMTKALIANGNKLKIDKSPIVDKHSVGGTNGRASMIIVPILAAGGFYCPKTSSRSITSSSGTADSMEVLAPVSLSVDQIKNITKKVGGVIAWGGAVALAPADDKIIKLEHPLSLDPEGQVIASVMAKKAAVGSEYVVIDIPVGVNVKIKSREKAVSMAKKFVAVGKELGMQVEAVITNGNEPSGPAFGPALESKHALMIMEGKLFDNLAQKSCELAGVIFEMIGKSKKDEGFRHAKALLEEGSALKKFNEIVAAQGGKPKSSDQIAFGKFSHDVVAHEDGEISGLSIKVLTKIARLAGAPGDKYAGVWLNYSVGDKVKKGNIIYKIYSNSKAKLDASVSFCEKVNPVVMEKIILEKIR